MFLRRLHSGRLVFLPLAFVACWAASCTAVSAGLTPTLRAAMTNVPEVTQSGPATTHALTPARASATPELALSTAPSSTAIPTTAIRATSPTSTAPGGTPVANTALPPFSTLPPGTPILPPGGQGAATDLHAELTCSEADPRMGVASLSWRPATQLGVEQRVVLTIYRDGFERGDFGASETLKPDQTTVLWQPLSGQAIHYWRVLTLHSEGWVPSETMSFTGPTCVADYQPGPSP